MTEGKTHPDYLPTAPGTQIMFTAAKPWCAGHDWRDHRGLRLVHELGHRLRILRIQPPRPFKYLEPPGHDSRI